jgi:hypothetical protein
VEKFIKMRSDAHPPAFVDTIGAIETRNEKEISEQRSRAIDSACAFNTEQHIARSFGRIISPFRSSLPLVGPFLHSLPQHFNRIFCRLDSWGLLLATVFEFRLKQHSGWAL